MPLKNDILRTLLYFDIWSYPLDSKELYTFLPVGSITLDQFRQELATLTLGDVLLGKDGYYFVGNRTPDIVDERRRREKHADGMWFWARVSMHLIKRFPFVRAVFVSGELSKNVTQKGSDVDFFILTEPNRLWIARTLLIGFKKLFLFNKKKYFCLNSFVSTARLELEDRSIYTAVEIATLKPLFNMQAFLQYLDANRWIKDYFPNFDISNFTLPRVSERKSLLQWFLELPFQVLDATRLDRYLMKSMSEIWAARYPHFDERTREKIFRCTPTESRAYVGNFEDEILALYERRLREFGVED